MTEWRTKSLRDRVIGFVREYVVASDPYDALTSLDLRERGVGYPAAVPAVEGSGRPGRRRRQPGPWTNEPPHARTHEYDDRHC